MAEYREILRLSREAQLAIRRAELALASQNQAFTSLTIACDVVNATDLRVIDDEPVWLDADGKRLTNGHKRGPKKNGGRK